MPPVVVSNSIEQGLMIMHEPHYSTDLLVWPSSVLSCSHSSQCHLIVMIIQYFGLLLVSVASKTCHGHHHLQAHVSSAGN